MNVAVPAQLPPESRRERVVATCVQLAPLLGIPLWIGVFAAHQNDWNYLLVFWFGLGIFMVAAGLAGAFGAWIAIRSRFVHAQAAGSLRFHVIAAVVVAVVCALIPASSALFDRGPFSESHPPAVLFASMGVGLVLCSAVLPLIEAARALICGASAWRGSR